MQQLNDLEICRWKFPKAFSNYRIHEEIICQMNSNHKWLIVKMKSTSRYALKFISFLKQIGLLIFEYLDDGILLKTETDNCLRWCIYKISKNGNGLENLVRNNFDIAMPQTSQKIKD